MGENISLSQLELSQSAAISFERDLESHIFEHEAFEQTSNDIPTEALCDPLV